MSTTTCRLKLSTEDERLLSPILLYSLSELQQGVPFPRSLPPSALSTRIVQGFQYHEGAFRITLKKPIAADVTNPASVLINKRLHWEKFGLVWTLQRSSALSGSFWSDLKHFVTEWKACQVDWIWGAEQLLELGCSTTRPTLFFMPSEMYMC
jgi:hypothetical protein